MLPREVVVQVPCELPGLPLDPGRNTLPMVGSVSVPLGLGSATLVGFPANNRGRLTKQSGPLRARCGTRPTPVTPAPSTRMQLSGPAEERHSSGLAKRASCPAIDRKRHRADGLYGRSSSEVSGSGAGGTLIHIEYVTGQSAPTRSDRLSRRDRSSAALSRTAPAADRRSRSGHGRDPSGTAATLCQSIIRLGSQREMLGNAMRRIITISSHSRNQPTPRNTVVSGIESPATAFTT